MSKRPKTVKVAGPGERGFAGVGGGRAGVMPAATEYRGTTVQVCGMWPFAAGSASPIVGALLGRHLHTGASVCADPISWFRAGLIHNPSMFVLAIPGVGKSTFVRHMLVGLSAFGSIPLVLGDVRPDYVDLVRALGGQVISLGRGSGYLNVLDGREARVAAEHLTGKAREQVLTDSHERRRTMVEALVSIARGTAAAEGSDSNVTDRESNLLGVAIELLDERHGTGQPPVLDDLLAIVKQAPEALRAVALDRGSMSRYLEVTDQLEATLMGLTGVGRLGEVFSRQTSEPMMLDRPVVYDLSGIPATQSSMRAAALLACWSNGFGLVEAAQTLADQGLAPRRSYAVVMDEIHQAVGAGPGMVRRMDSLTRLNRQIGVGSIYITHTMKDLLALPTEAERMIASGFVERSGMLALGGLPADEMPRLNTVTRLSQAEQDLLTSWTNPAPFDARTGAPGTPPGRGLFMLKVGGKPGIPLEVQLTSVESGGGIHDTNKRWHDESRIGDRDGA